MPANSPAGIVERLTRWKPAIGVRRDGSVYMSFGDPKGAPHIQADWDFGRETAELIIEVFTAFAAANAAREKAEAERDRYRALLKDLFERVGIEVGKGFPKYTGGAPFIMRDVGQALADSSAVGETEDAPPAAPPGGAAGNICDCERGHNGLGLSGRECDCPAGSATPYVPEPTPPAKTAYRIEHDGFTGDQIGDYVTREGKRGKVLQQHGSKVVHVYGEKWCVPIDPPSSPSAGAVRPALAFARQFIGRRAGQPGAEAALKLIDKALAQLGGRADGK